MVLLLKILGGVVALAIGIWLGLPAPYRQSEADIEKALDSPDAARRRTRRHITPLDWFNRRKGGHDRRRARREAFRVTMPERDGVRGDVSERPRVRLRSGPSDGQTERRSGGR